MATIEEQDYCVIARVDDSCDFVEKIENLPAESLPLGYQLIKAPTEDIVKFFCSAPSEDFAIARFMVAGMNAGLSAAILSVEN